MIFLKKKNKKNSDPKPAKKKSPWKRNSWLRLNLPDDFSSTIEIPQLQSEKIQTSVFAVNTTEFNSKGEDLSPTTNTKPPFIEHKPIGYDDLSCSRNNQLINKQQKESNEKVSLQQDNDDPVQEYSTPETVCDALGVTNLGKEQVCRKAESEPAYCEKVMDTISSSHGGDNDTESPSMSTSLSSSDSVESSLKTELPLKKEPVLEKEPSLQQGEDQLSTEKIVKPVPVSSLKPDNLKEEEVSHKEESKVMKRKSAQSFIPRSCKQPSGVSPEEESPLRGSSSSHLPVLVVAKNSTPTDNNSSSSSSSCSTHSQDSVEKKAASKIPTVVPAKNVKSNSPKAHTSRLPKKRNT
ncbi:hypothetical protein K501DRAFT_269162 [Backusella circina FSU 941]|nr:hypothetical protein K501DRAFT_269162 [Backusella circina FSU 941]